MDKLNHVEMYLINNHPFSSSVLRWEFIKENKKVRKHERKHALDQEKKKVFFLIVFLVESV